MSRMKPGMTMALMLAQGLAPSAMAAGSAMPAEVTYHTHVNDTLYDLARRYFNHFDDYRVVQQLNHVAIPEHLQPDVDLRIPVNLLRGAPQNATVLTYRGDVRLGEDRHPVTPGTTLSEGMRIETGPSSFLSFRAPDGSTVTMPSQSVMRLERMRRILFTNTMDQRFTIERGRLETTVAKQIGPASHYEVRTPIAVSAVRGTVFRVAYGADGRGKSLTEVLGGTVAVSGNGMARPVPVPVGLGAAVGRDGSVETETLLPAPALSEGNRLQEGQELRFSAAPVAGAQAYHFDVARDAAFRDIVGESRSAMPQGELAGLPDGTWYVRATALSRTGMEGLPAIQPFERRLHVFDAAMMRSSGREYRVHWTYAGAPGVHFRFQLEPTGKPKGHGKPFGLDEDRLFARTLVLDDVPAGPYRWRLGAINGTDETWTAWREVTIEHNGEHTGEHTGT
ncbi:MAG: FecR domain-containing protein [Sphingomonadales bacterium]|nr:FecR domain-containing protein [Sphingomonadales bacterium]